MKTTDKYILEGTEVVPCYDLFEWAQWLEEHHDERFIAETFLGDGEVRVSTIFLGLNYRFGISEAPPFVFETIVFGGPLNCNIWRWSTYHEAEQGHEEVVRECREQEIINRQLDGGN